MGKLKTQRDYQDYVYTMGLDPACLTLEITINLPYFAFGNN